MLTPDVLPGALLPAPEHGDVPLTVTDPASGAVVAQVAGVPAAVAARAVTAAHAAGPGWAATPTARRAEALRAIAADLRAAAEETGEGSLALLVTRETGKRLAESRAEIGFSAAFFDWFAEAAPHADGSAEDPVGLPGRRFTVRRVPLGVVAAVTPWNFPLSIPARKAAAALAAGCTVVLKSSELAPASALRLAEICLRHLPEGALTVVAGDGAGLTGALVADPRVAALTFTGSTRVGGIVAGRAAARFLPAVLELGGRGPFLITEDADPEAAVEALMVAKFRNNGASCIAANNVCVHRSQYDTVLRLLAERVEKLRVGDPADDSVDLGPVISRTEQDRLNGLVTGAERAGAPVRYGAPVPGQGTFVRPAVVECHDDLDLWTGEIFGPVVAIRPYEDEDRVVDEINGWGYGLGGYVCAPADRARALASRLRIGIVGINNGAPNHPRVPFGGFGASGLGREGGVTGLLEFTTEQTLSE
ncbi:aldehyde dehydrogenase family protein [Streptomyces lycii]|uniref:Aldehyde dehydrogenase family protein n=2 Tax=Streptomyces TaxID=1883 RepID=A0ABQ7FHJ4_9ACTN|nr:aldehyde dehydrogenase family protein [Streptomyces lycii]KAF4408481.1 aldehyde dehydrogenase family protein [Streptomyces lycii]